MYKFSKKNILGFSIVEILIVIGILAVILSITVGVFVQFKNREALDKDIELVKEVLSQAKHLTLNSKDSNQFGVHFNSNSVVIFIGPVYLFSSSTNQVYNFNSDVVLYGTSLNGGGVDILFKKLSGSTDNDGIITLKSNNASTTKSLTVYKTGIVQ